MFETLHSDINPLKSCLLTLTGQLKGGAAKVKDGIISVTKFLGTFSVDRFNFFFFVTYEKPDKLEGYITQNWKGLLGTNTLAYRDHL